MINLGEALYENLFDEKSDGRNIVDYHCDSCKKIFKGRLLNRDGVSRNDGAYYFCNDCHSALVVDYSKEPFISIVSILKHDWPKITSELTNNIVKPCECGGRFEDVKTSNCPYCGTELDYKEMFVAEYIIHEKEKAFRNPDLFRAYKDKVWFNGNYSALVAHEEARRLYKSGALHDITDEHVRYFRNKMIPLVVGKVYNAVNWFRFPAKKSVIKLFIDYLENQPSVNDHTAYTTYLSSSYSYCQCLGALTGLPVEKLPHPLGERDKLRMQANDELTSILANKGIDVNKINSVEKLGNKIGFNQLKSICDSITKKTDNEWDAKKEDIEKPWREAVLKEITKWKVWWSQGGV